MRINLSLFGLTPPGLPEKKAQVYLYFQPNCILPMVRQASDLIYHCSCLLLTVYVVNRGLQNLFNQKMLQCLLDPHFFQKEFFPRIKKGNFQENHDSTCNLILLCVKGCSLSRFSRQLLLQELSSTLMLVVWS